MIPSEAFTRERATDVKPVWGHGDRKAREESRWQPALICISVLRPSPARQWYCFPLAEVSIKQNANENTKGRTLNMISFMRRTYIA